MTKPAAKTTVLFIFMVVLVDVIGLGIIVPVVPKLIMHLTGEGISRAATYAGWLGFTYAMMQFFCAPILGNLSDQLGRRPVILFSVFSLGIDYLIMGLAPTLSWLFLGRALSGIAGASFIPAYAYLADVSPPERRAQNFGLVGVAFGVGFIVGPALGGLLGTLGPHTPFFASAGLSLANGIFGYFVLPESLPKESRRPFQLKRANSLGTLMQIRKYPLVPGMAAAIFLLQLGHQALPSTWSFYTIFKFHWTEAAVGGSLAFIGLMMATSQGVLTRVVIPRIGERRTALIGLMCATTAYLGFAVATRGWMMYAWMTAWLMAGLVYPSMNAIMSQQVPANAQGELQGAVGSLYSLASVVGPPLMTQLFGYFSSHTEPVYLPGAAFVCAAILMVGAGSLLVRVLLRARAARARAAAAAAGAAALIVFVVIGGAGCDAKQHARVATRSPIVIEAQFAGSTPFIPVQVNGQGPFWFILDTGANSCVLADSLAQVLGLEPLGEGEGSGAGGAIGYHKYAPDAAIFEVGGARCTCEHTISVDFSGQPAIIGRRVDGVLGSDFIAQFVVELDYDQSRVTLHDTTGYTYHGKGVEVPLTFVRRVPYLTAELAVGGRAPVPRRLLIDTGSQDAVDDSLLLTAPVLSDAEGGVGLGTRRTVSAGTFDHVRFGGFEFRDVPGVAPGVCLVGGEVLRRFHLVFDYKRARMFAEPARDIDAPFPPIGNPAE